MHDCCDSLQQSSCRNDVEFILVDAASSDSTLEQLQVFAQADHRFKVVTQAGNLGPSSARNDGLDAANGRLVSFIDGDDWVRRGFYDEVIDLAHHFRPAAFIKFNLIKARDTSRTVLACPAHRKNVLMNSRDVILPFNQTTMVDMPHNAAGVYNLDQMAKTDLQFDEALCTAEDRPWTWSHYLAGHNMVASTLSGYFYRQHEPTASTSPQLTRILDERQAHFAPAYKAIFEMVYCPEHQVFAHKAIRQFLAIFYHNINRAGLGAAVIGEMCRLSRDALSLVPKDEFENALAKIDSKRRRSITRHLLARDCGCN